MYLVSMQCANVIILFFENANNDMRTITSGTSNASWRYLVKIKGIKWPMCSESEEGPRPVYK